MPPSQKAKIPLTPARGQSSNVLGRVCALLLAVAHLGAERLLAQSSSGSLPPGHSRRRRVRTSRAVSEDIGCRADRRASGQTWTAPTSAPPPARCCPGTPAMTPTSPVPSWRSAVSPVQAAAQNAKPTPTCMSTAASAPKHAAVASRPAPTCWAVLADAGGARDTAGAGSA